MYRTSLPASAQNMQQRYHFPWALIGFLFAISCGVIVIAVTVVQLLCLHRVQTERSNVRPAEVAIVLGASVRQNQTPSDALNDRILSAVSLYKEGLVQKLLMTGDDGAFHNDEVSVMVRVAEEAGVPREDILTDGQGYRTYESCERAIESYHIREAVVVTQRFHLARALFLCNELGMEATGYVADRNTYRDINHFWIRDLLASVKAFYDVYIQNPEPPIKPETSP
ncbi:hypothetical protein GF380_01830 [Candidatus Uhrbacteria bacterium]|nr:hypothetical protein [Candidatus Uhrbacteria bacterium]